MDLDYWRAKLQSWAFAEPKLIHEEQAVFRRDVLAPVEAPLPEEDWLARVAAIHQKMQRAGLVPSTSGAVN